MSEVGYDKTVVVCVFTFQPNTLPSGAGRIIVSLSVVYANINLIILILDEAEALCVRKALVLHVTAIGVGILRNKLNYINED